MNLIIGNLIGTKVQSETGTVGRVVAVWIRDNQLMFTILTETNKFFSDCAYGFRSLELTEAQSEVVDMIEKEHLAAK